MIAFVHDDGLVLFGASHELFAASLAESLDEDSKLLAFVFLVLLGADLGLQFDEFIESGYLCLL